MDNTKDYRDCIDACHNCALSCLETVNFCLNEGGMHAKASHIRTMLDCIEICETAVSYMARDSDHAIEVCRICAEVCRHCSASCRKLGGDEMDRCAEVCDSAAKECEIVTAEPMEKVV